MSGNLLTASIKKVFVHLRAHTLLKILLDLKVRIKPNAISIKTSNPIAIKSADHQYPVGAINDNFARREFIEDFLESYPDCQSFLDLGCAGGQLIMELEKKGILSIGIDGSTSVLLGIGRGNWFVRYGKSLFFADITKPFWVLKKELPFHFDVVHAEEVFEHLSELEAESTITNIKSLMTNSSVLLLGISSQLDCRITGIGKKVTYHKTVKSPEWWVDFFRPDGLETLSEAETKLDTWGWPLRSSNRSSVPQFLSSSVPHSMFFGLKLATKKVEFNSIDYSDSEKIP